MKVPCSANVSSGSGRRRKNDLSSAATVAMSSPIRTHTHVCTHAQSRKRYHINHKGYKSIKSKGSIMFNTCIAVIAQWIVPTNKSSTRKNWFETKKKKKKIRQFKIYVRVSALCVFMCFRCCVCCVCCVCWVCCFCFNIPKL